ncbi:MAG: hypothetical protein GY927_20080 [bacterium]|nr:hypothetical protein [bacterium]
MRTNDVIWSINGAIKPGIVTDEIVSQSMRIHQLYIVIETQENIVILAVARGGIVMLGMGAITPDASIEITVLV